MVYRLLLILAGLLSTSVVHAQKDAAIELNDTHPLIGLWKYTGKNGKSSIIFDEDETKYVRFICCGKESYSSIGYYGSDGFGGISTFVPKVKDNKIYFTLISCVAVVLRGLEVELTYSLSKDDQKLTLERNGKKFLLVKINDLTKLSED